jgi:hypothetical protein
MSLFSRTLVAASLAAFALATTAAAQAPTPGWKWRIKTSMSMMGMSMPASTAEVCTPKDKPDAAPVEQRPECRIYDYKTVGKTTSMKMSCTGKDPMEGSMEITYDSPEHYIGKMNAKMNGESMVMNYEGKRIGECDASEMERKINKMLADNAAAQAKQCAENAATLGAAEMHFGPNAICKDPKDRKTWCDRFQSYEGYSKLAGLERAMRSAKAGTPGARPLSDGAKNCGVAADTVRARLCSGAEAKGKLNFILNNCPAEAKVISQRECSTRGFSVVASQPKYESFCGGFAAGEAQEDGGDQSASGDSGNAGSQGAGRNGAAQPASGDPAAPEGEKPANKATDAVKKGTKALKNILGF